ncbi:amino acid synthesis family protein [Paramicrobacterium chengjingii]|uniref:amino acid synthesis family protein n=1 Tax=Paramicrobacterium chengjingii TaxID=2769067 RepID=UPI001422E619|nr:amino acid synthesis family protein [Microbacterium chengjingii]
MAPSEFYAQPPASLEHLDPGSIEARWGLRKIVLQQSETFSEGGSQLSTPITQFAAVAVVKNPWVGRGTGSELVDSPVDIAARLAKLLSDRILARVGEAEAIEAFGKGAITGEAGELEHGAALTHTPYFASNLRAFFGGTAVISFSDSRGPAGDPLNVPLCEKHSGVVRAYYQSCRVSIADAPLPDEIVLIAAASTGPRPFPRVGDRMTDRPMETSQMNGVIE